MLRFCALAAAVGLVLACSGQNTKGKTKGNTGSQAGPSRFALFVTTELRGTIEPCGCTSDPLGDLARTAQQIAEARAAGLATLHVDGGSTLFSEVPIPPHLATQEALKADLIRRAFADSLGTVAVGLGRNDLPNGPEAISIPRQAANLPPDTKIPVETPKVIEAGGVKVGIFGVISPDAISQFGISPTDPTSAARDAVAALREQGARIVVGLVHMDRRGVVELVKAVPGIDFAVIGRDAPEPNRVKDAPSRVGETWLLQPANRGQVVTRLDVFVRDAAGPIRDAIGEARAAAEIAALRPRLEQARADLAALEQNPEAEPAFVAAREQAVAEMAAELAALERDPVRVPDKGSYFTMAQIRIRKGLPCDPTVQAQKQAFDRAAGEANVKAAAGKTPPPPAAGEPSYAGIEECDMCHPEAVAFWRKTKHAAAWDTLEQLGKQWSYECIGCHVTGWDRPGGANLAVNEALRDVQCETCHGPGSIHVEEDGKEKPKTLVLASPESLCVTCHSPEHSDTFDYKAYLRDVTGPGHGEAYRKALGEGPTGGELRSAALAKAGASIGEGCAK